MRVGYDCCRAEVLCRVEGQEKIVGCCRAIDWKNEERRCVHHRGHCAEMQVGIYPAACLQHRTGAVFYCVKRGFVDYEQFCILRRNEGFLVRPLSMVYEVSEEERRVHDVIRNGHYHDPSGARVLMYDERGSEILMMHGWPLYSRFQDSEDALTWVTGAGPEANP